MPPPSMAQILGSDSKTFPVASCAHIPHAVCAQNNGLYGYIFTRFQILDIISYSYNHHTHFRPEK